MSRVVLIGMADELAGPLIRVLRQEAHQVNQVRSAHRAQSRFQPEIAFVSADRHGFEADITRLRQLAPDIPIVVVTREPELSRWLDGLEAGASDYWCAPFERVQVRWIMSSVRPAARRRAAA